MRVYYSDTEAKKALKDLTVVIDTREQVNQHVIDWLDAKKVQHKTRKLDVGDYSAMLGDRTLERDVVIEKKNGLDEIAGNFTVDRQRFENEFLRAKAGGTKVFLLIENATWEDIYAHNYLSRLEPKALAASLLTWQTRYGITIIFCRSEGTGRMIYNILYYWAREALVG
jgi:ERCC4-type nuclease